MNLESQARWASIRHGNLFEGKRACSRFQSEALPVDDCWARLVVLTLGDPHLLEGAQGGKDGATDPNRVLALWWSHDLDLHGGWCQGCEFLGHSLTNASKHGSATRENHVAVQVLTNVHIALH